MNKHGKEELLHNIFLVVVFGLAMNTSLQGFQIDKFFLSLLLIPLMGTVMGWLFYATKITHGQWVKDYIFLYLFMFLIMVGVFHLAQSEGFANFISLWKERISAVIDWIFVG